MNSNQTLNPNYRFEFEQCTRVHLLFFVTQCLFSLFFSIPQPWGNFQHYIAQGSSQNSNNFLTFNVSMLHRRAGTRPAHRDATTSLMFPRRRVARHLSANRHAGKQQISRCIFLFFFFIQHFFCSFSLIMFST